MLIVVSATPTLPSSPFLSARRSVSIGFAPQRSLPRCGSTALAAIGGALGAATAAAKRRTETVAVATKLFRREAALASAFALTISPQVCKAESAPAEEVYAIDASGARMLPSGERWEPLLAASDVVLLGEHHDSENDHKLEYRIIERLKANSGSRPVAVGMEMVQTSFQSVCDDFVNGRISEDELYKGTQWETRWIWEFSKYLPIFKLCRDKGMRVLALNTDSESLAKVERSGLEGLDESDWQRLIPDKRGFGAMGRDEGFKDYLRKIVAPSYTMHEQMGILKQTVTGQILTENMPLKNFVGGRLLWDETMATNTVRYLASEEGRGGLVCVMAGGDHVRYQYGLKARIERIATSSFAKEAGCSGGLKVSSVMLNPSLQDGQLDGGAICKPTPDGGTVRVPFADYIFHTVGA